MACNCSTKEELDRLYKLYGDKSRLSDNPKIKDYVRYYGGNGLAYLSMFICFPLMVLYIIFLLFWREKPELHIKDIDLIKRFKIRI